MLFRFQCPMLSRGIGKELLLNEFKLPQEIKSHYTDTVSTRHLEGCSKVSVYENFHCHVLSQYKGTFNLSIGETSKKNKKLVHRALNMHNSRNKFDSGYNQGSWQIMRCLKITESQLHVFTNPKSLFMLI